MKKALLFIFSFAGVCQAQNLVNNPGFELYAQCTHDNQMFYASNWNAPPSSHPFCVTPNLLTPCNGNSLSAPNNLFGSQTAHDGVSYAGIYVYGDGAPGANPLNEMREYVQTQLSTPLVAGTTYRVSFFVSLCDNFLIGIGSVGAHLSVDPLVNNPQSCAHITAVPQIISENIITDKEGWVEIWGNYVAQGGEQYLTIGNFRNNADTPKTIFSVPPVTIGYFSYYYIDTVEVKAASLNVNQVTANGLTIHPNPIQDVMTIEYEGKSAEDFIEIYSVYGQFIMKVPATASQVDLSNLQKGIYLLRLDRHGKKTVEKIAKI